MEEYTDLITGELLPYSDDEYIRQDAEALLLERGYGREDVEVDVVRCLEVDGCSLVVKADLLIHAQGRPALIMRCARGSLVTREKEVIACARLLNEVWVPFAMTFNKDSAELLETASGKILEQGRTALPDPNELARMVSAQKEHLPSAEETSKAARVYRAFSFIHCPGKCTV